MEIRTSKHSETQPEPITKDSKGNLLETGVDVAYNRSGSVERGELIEIVRNEWVNSRRGLGPKSWWYLKFEAVIKNYEDDRISRIKNPNSILIL